jgi:hypothetical protein
VNHEYFYHSKDDMQKQLILIRKKFEHYADFGKATVQDVFTSEEMKGVTVLKANYMKSVWFENIGGGKFTMHVLHNEAQLAPLYGIQCKDDYGDDQRDMLRYYLSRAVTDDEDSSDESLAEKAEEAYLEWWTPTGKAATATGTSGKLISDKSKELLELKKNENTY